MRRHPSRQLLATLVSRGMANTELEALAFLRALRAVDLRQCTTTALRRPAYRSIPAGRRAQIAVNATQWRSR